MQISTRFQPFTLRNILFFFVVGKTFLVITNQQNKLNNNLYNYYEHFFNQELIFITFADKKAVHNGNYPPMT